MTKNRADRIKGRKESGDIIAMKCKFNTDYYGWFLVDTGSAITAISQPMARQIGIDTNKPIRWLEITSIHKTDKVPIVRLDNFQVGSHKVSNLDVAILSLPANLRIDGLLGVNFLRHFRTTFEFDQATLVLRPFPK